MNPSIYPSTVPANTFDKIMEREFMPIVGKNVLCKAQGLKGAEKRLCEKQILAKCGRRPILLASKSKKNAWEKCAQSVQVVPPIDITNTNAGTGGGGTGDTTGGTGADTGNASDDADAQKAAGGLPSWVIPVGIIAAIAIVGGGIYYFTKKPKIQASPTGK